jgi:ketosteroid isomerase-like protein
MSNIDIVQAVLRANEAGDTATLATLYTDDFLFSGPVPQPMDKTTFLHFIRTLHTAIPDFTFHPRDWREEGDRVYATADITGTHTGTLAVIPDVPPVPATGKAIRLPNEQFVFTVRNGQAARWEVTIPPGGGVPGIYAQVGAPLPQS